MQAPVSVQDTVTYPPGALPGQERIVVDGVRGAIYEYGNNPVGPGDYSITAAGNPLVGSWASSAGTDPYGNVYPQGLNITVGSIIGPVIEGALINGGQISGSDFNIEGSGGGLFVYSGSPGPLNANYTFAQGISPWTGFDNATVAPSSLNTFGDSPGSMLITPDGVTAAPGAVSERFPVTAGAQYGATAQVVVPAGWATGMRVNIRWFNSGGGLISQFNGPATAVPANTETQLVQAPATAPAGAVTASFVVGYVGTPASSVTAYVGLASFGNYGTLTDSFAGAAGTDQFGNTYPAGLHVTDGVISGPDYVINSSGIFFYSGTPANGNLIGSVTAASGTDGFGNTYEQGTNTYNGIAIVQLFNAIVSIGLIGAPTLAQIELYGGGSSQLGLQLRSGQGAASDTQASIALTNTSAGWPSVCVSQGTAVEGPAASQLFQVYGPVLCGVITAWQPGSGFTAPESWNTLGPPGITGWTSNHGRYRMTPDGEVEFDITLTSNGVAHASSVTTYPNTLPAAYQPAFNRVYPLSLDTTITAGDPYPRLYITTTGTVKIAIPSVGASVIDIGGNIRMPLD